MSCCFPLGIQIWGQAGVVLNTAREEVRSPPCSVILDTCIYISNSNVVISMTHKWHIVMTVDRKNGKWCKLQYFIKRNIDYPKILPFKVHEVDHNVEPLEGKKEKDFKKVSPGSATWPMSGQDGVWTIIRPYTLYGMKDLLKICSRTENFLRTNKDFERRKPVYDD